MQKKSIIFLLSLLVFLPLSYSYTLEVHNQNDFSIGIAGGYGFPQIGFWKTSSSSNYKIESGDEYSFGLAFNYFLLNNLALNTEVLYTYNSLNLILDDDNEYNWQAHFIDINTSILGYWVDLLYFGGGLYLRIPYYKTITDLPDFIGKTQFTVGLLIDLGVDIKLQDHFAIKVGLRSHIPFLGYHNITNNKYSLWSFPINFSFALQYII